MHTITWCKYLVNVHDKNYLVNEPVYNNLVKLPEERMLLAPDIREDEPSHVCESRNLRKLVFGVVRPDVCHKQLHHVESSPGTWPATDR